MVILDMDSSVSPTHDDQEGTAYNGHFGCTCYHPLFLFNQFGDLKRCSLCPGNIHNVDDWENVLGPIVIRFKGWKVLLFFRGDAAPAGVRPPHTTWSLDRVSDRQISPFKSGT